jgi:hypothetical protein
VGVHQGVDLLDRVDAVLAEDGEERVESGLDCLAEGGIGLVDLDTLVEVTFAAMDLGPDLGVKGCVLLG